MPLPTPPGPPEPREATPGMLEARAARQDATDGLMAAIQRGPEVRETARKVAEHGRRNHFIDLLNVTLPREEPH